MPGGETLTLALWATSMAMAPTGPVAFLDRVDAMLERAAAAGAELLVMPEYVSEAWLAWAPRDLPETAEIGWMAAQALELVPRLGERARARGIALLAGTVPVAAAGRFRNRAHLFLPDGRVVTQDKLVLTPDETNPAAWLVEPGAQLNVASWRGLRLATVICLDIEQPALAARLQSLALDLVLVPSDTARLAGHQRVFACARARAVELFAVVAAVGAVGAVPTDPPRPNVSGAAVYLPCETALGATGVHAELPPHDTHPDDGALLIAKEVPWAEVRRQRAAGGEVWPGAWAADDILIREFG